MSKLGRTLGKNILNIGSCLSGIMVYAIILTLRLIVVVVFKIECLHSKLNFKLSKYCSSKNKTVLLFP